MKTQNLGAKDFTWTAWTVRDIKKIAQEAVTAERDMVEQIKQTPPAKRSFETMILPFERYTRYASRTISPLGLLLSLSPKKSIRDACEQALNDIDHESIDIIHDKALYDTLRSFRFVRKQYDEADQLLFKSVMRQFKRMGFDLPEKEQARLKVKKKELSKLSTAFDSALNAYEDYLLVTKEELDGLPESFITSLPKQAGKYKVTLAYPHYFPVMDYAHDESVRKRLAEKFYKKGGRENLKRLTRIVRLRDEIARMLGYDHHADFVLENRMAKTSATVLGFLEGLEKATRVEGRAEVRALIARKKRTSARPFGVHDIRYFENILTEESFSINHEKIREYLPLDHVTNEAFKLFEHLFAISIKPIKLPTWHKDVTTYYITDKASKQTVGYFALDLFPRTGKFKHAAVSCLYKGHADDTTYHPGFSVMMGNFRKPTKTNPSLLSHDELTTYLHEFGHLLHGTLTKARYASQSGTSVKWDFVELPSQLMENWMWEQTILKRFTKHYETGKPLPQTDIDNLIASRRHLVYYGTRRQLAFGLFDMTMHTKTPTNIQKLYKETIEKITGIPQPQGSLMPAGFGHMVGYDAGYYSYMWALVFARDVFSEFSKRGITNKSLGKKLRQTILEKGSSRDEMTLLREFLGRRPNDKAFVKFLSGK